MARLARFVAPGAAHHVTRRGNGRQQTFFRDTDYAACRDMLATQCAALSKVHRAYAGRIRARGKRTGHFRQGRFDRDPRPARRGPKPKRQLSAPSP